LPASNLKIYTASIITLYLPFNLAKGAVCVLPSIVVSDRLSLLFKKNKKEEINLEYEYDDSKEEKEKAEENHKNDII
ncbi:MAG: hypothetical protein LBV51_05530, partial [Acholeplasmatales bacterium]|nr:hypothetical protein [Acholeplasmatales bacterium]